jgi:UDP-glucuronate 4-epimerase
VSEKNKICITGAAGFIGSHLVDRLLSLGHQLIGIDNMCDFYYPKIKRENMLGSDRPIRLDRLIHALEKVLGKKAQIERLPVPPGDVIRTWADLTLARESLGYEPKTALDEGFHAFYEWLRERQ